MNSDAFLESIFSLGLKASRDGIIYGPRGDYMIIGDFGVCTQKGVVDYASISSPTYLVIDGTVTLILNGGEEIVLRPSPLIELAEGFRRSRDAWWMDVPGAQAVQAKEPVKEDNIVRRRPAPVYEEDIPTAPAPVKSVVAEPVRMKSPQLTSALVDMLPVMYGRKDLKDCFWYDELNERQMVDTSVFGRDSGIRPMSDELMCIYHDNVERRLIDMDVEGRMPSMSVRDEALNVLFADNHRNQFREWIESFTWDGVRRIPTLFRDLFGGTAPALRGLENGLQREAEYLATVGEAWLLGAVARAYEEVKHEIVPVFIGTQGIGKGTALKYLAGKDEWYRDTTTDFSDPKRFLDSVRGSIIVELGEGVQLDTEDLGTLKAFISQSSDHMRKAYARHDNVYPRHFIMAASSNTDTLFTDPTGARRFYPVYCDPAVQRSNGMVIPSHGRPEELQHIVEQIWAEALEMYRQGHKWYIADAESTELSRAMQAFCADERDSDMIADYLDDPMNGFSHVGAMVSRLTVFQRIFGIEPPFSKIPDEVTKAWKQWISYCPGWERVPSPVKVDGKTTRVYRRVHEPGRLPERCTFNMVDGNDYAMQRSAEDLPETVRRDDDDDGPSDLRRDEVPQKPAEDPYDLLPGIPEMEEADMPFSVAPEGVVAEAPAEPVVMEDDLEEPVVMEDDLEEPAEEEGLSEEMERKYAEIDAELLKPAEEDVAHPVEEEPPAVAHPDDEEKRIEEAFKTPAPVKLEDMCVDPEYTEAKRRKALREASARDRAESLRRMDAGKDPLVSRSYRDAMWKDAMRMSESCDVDPVTVYGDDGYVPMDVPVGTSEPYAPPSDPKEDEDVDRGTLTELVRAWAEGRGYSEGTVIERSSLSQSDTDMLLSEGFAVMRGDDALQLVRLSRGVPWASGSSLSIRRTASTPSTPTGASS